MFIEILFKMLLFKGGVLIYAEHCIYVCVSARLLFPLSTHKTPIHADGLFGIIILFVTAVVL